MGFKLTLRYHGLRLARLSASPHSIGIGLASGVFMGFSPIFGVHIIAAVALAWPFGGNPFAAVVGTLVCNVTCPAMLWADHAVGVAILGQNSGLADNLLATAVGWPILGGIAGLPSYYIGKLAVVGYRQRRTRHLAGRAKETRG